MSSDLRVRTIAPTNKAASEAWRNRLASHLPVGAWRTRFAPAPTGYLHLGHLVNAIYVWGIARAFGGNVVLRIEDHDRSRCRPEFESALLDDLDWLGFSADVAPSASYRAQRSGHWARQSDNSLRYEDALNALDSREWVYACSCTRREIDAVAPHAVGEEPRYPGTCRSRALNRDVVPARRVLVEPGGELFDDIRLGQLSQEPSMQCGDVLIRDRTGQWTYQFAVVVDDLAHGIDVIIRGEDLLASTGRQRRLRRLLTSSTASSSTNSALPIVLDSALPKVLHHPLLVHSGGAKLSKANGDTALRARRARGETAEKLIGEAAHLAGLADSPAPLSAQDVAMLFRAAT